MGQHATRGCAILGLDLPAQFLLLGYRKICEEIWSLYLHVVLCLIRAGIILQVENYNLFIKLLLISDWYTLRIKVAIHIR